MSEMLRCQVCGNTKCFEAASHVSEGKYICCTCGSEVTESVPRKRD